MVSISEAKNKLEKIENKTGNKKNHCIGFSEAMRPDKVIDIRYYLSKKFPIVSGIIEGACRHLINDRFDITGARWGLQTAEGVLKLRAI